MRIWLWAASDPQATFGWANPRAKSRPSLAAAAWLLAQLRNSFLSGHAEVAPRVRAQFGERSLMWA